MTQEKAVATGLRQHAASLLSVIGLRKAARFVVG